MDKGVDQYGWVRMDGVEGQHFSMCLFTPARRPAFAYACFGDLGFAKRAAERTLWEWGREAKGAFGSDRELENLCHNVTHRLSRLRRTNTQSPHAGPAQL